MTPPLPPGWSLETLEDLACEVRASVTPTPGAPYELWSVPSFADGRPERLRGEQIGSVKRSVAPGDLLLCKINPRINRVWLVGPKPNDATQVASPEWIVLRMARPDVDGRFLLHFLRSPVFRHRIEGTVHGVTGSHTRARVPEVMTSSVPLPPLDEQRRIVDILEDHISRLDAADTYLEAVTARLESLRIARWRSTFGGLAESWTVRPLLEVAAIENGQTPRGLAEALLGEPSTESVPFYKVGDMNAGDGQTMSKARFHVTRSAARTLGVHIRPAGCILIPKRGGAISTNKKRLLSTEAGFDLNTMGLRPAEGVRQRYLWHWLDGIDLGAIADGSNVPQINATQIRRLSLPVPSLDVQDAACNELDVFMSQRLAAGAEVRRSRRRAASLRKALSAAAFTGRLAGHPSDLDLAEELVS